MCGDSSPPPFNPADFNSAIPSVTNGPYNLEGAQSNAAMLQANYPWIVPPQGAFAGAQGAGGNTPQGVLAGTDNPFLKIMARELPGMMGDYGRRLQGKPEQAPAQTQNPLQSLMGGNKQIPIDAILKALSMAGGSGGAA